MTSGTKRTLYIEDGPTFRLKIERFITTAVYAALASSSIAAGAILAAERHADPAPDRPAPLRINPPGSYP